MMLNYHRDPRTGLYLPPQGIRRPRPPRRASFISSGAAAQRRNYNVLFGDTGGDPFFANVSLLLHGDGVDGGTVLTDSSKYAHVPTASSAWTTTTSQSVFGGSALTRGSSPIRYTTVGQSEFLMESGAFTWEFWIRQTSLTNFTAFGGQDSGNTGGERWFLGTSNLDGSSLRVWINGSTAGTSGTGLLLTNTWQFVAMTRSGTTANVYLDGVLRLTVTMTNNFNSTANSFCVGGNLSGTNQVNPFMDDVRLTKGVARYSGSTMTVPTAPFPNS